MAKQRREQGTVRRRGDRYQATIQLKAKRVWRSFSSAKEAWDWIATVKADSVRGSSAPGAISAPATGPAPSPAPAAPTGITFADVCRLYKLHKIKRWRPDTLRFFKGHAEGRLVRHFGERPISSITARDVQQYLDGELDRPVLKRDGTPSGRCVSPVTVVKYQQLLSQVFNYAVRMDYLPKSPLAGVERVKVTANTEFRVLRAHELRAFVAALDGEDRAFFTVMALTGLRKSEMFRLAWSWCDFEKGMLRIRVAKRGSNTIPMSPLVRQALLELGPKPDQLVFPGRSRRKTDPQLPEGTKQATDRRKPLWAGLKAAGIDARGIGFHTFRRTFLTLVEQIPGVTYSVVRALARHGTSSTDITARYLKPSVDQLRLALEQLEGHIFGPTNVVLFPQAAGQ